MRCLLVLGVAFLIGTHRVMALAGNLDRPSLALPESMAAEWQTKVLKVIQDPEAGFVNGRFINATTVLRYAGDTEALNRFLGGLGQCSEIRLRLRLVRDLDCSWVVHHNGWADAREFGIDVALGSDRIQLENLRLPTIVGRSIVEHSSPEEKPSLRKPAALDSP